jgi:hypothetical protein
MATWAFGFHETLRFLTTVMAQPQLKRSIGVQR